MDKASYLVKHISIFYKCPAKGLIIHLVCHLQFFSCSIINMKSESTHRRIISFMKMSSYTTQNIYYSSKVSLKLLNFHLHLTSGSQALHIVYTLCGHLLYGIVNKEIKNLPLRKLRTIITMDLKKF